MTDPQHKPGDIVNGHRLTAQPDGTLVWLAVEVETPATRSRKPLWITLGAAVGLLLLIIIIGSLNRPSGNDATPAAGNASASEAAEELEAVQLVTVPAGLVGMTANDAADALAAVGLKAVYDGEPTAKVLSWGPPVYRTTAGSTITLKVEQHPR